MKLKRILPAVMTWLAVSVFAMSQALLAPLAALISADFGHGLGWSGLLFAAGCIPYIVVGPFAGRLLSAAGRHFSVSLALAVGAVSAVCLSYADRFWLVCLGLALLGTAAVFVLPAGAAAVSALGRMPVADCMPSCAAAASLGAVFGAACGGVMTHLGYGWRKVYFVFGVAAGVAAVLHTLVPFPRLAAVRMERWRSEFRSAVRMQRMYGCFFIVTLYAAAETLAVGWMGAYMTHTLGYTLLIASAAVAIICACAFAGRLTCIALAGRVTPQGLSSVLSLLLVCALGLCAAVPDGKIFWFAMCFIGIGLSGLWQLLFSAALEVNGGGSATLSALLMWHSAGAGLASVAAGAVGGRFGTRTMPVMALVLFLAVGFLLGQMLTGKKAARRACPDWSAQSEEFADPLLEDEEVAALDAFAEPDAFIDLDEFADLDEYAALEPLGDYDPVDDFDGIKAYRSALRFTEYGPVPLPESAEPFLEEMEFDDLADPVEDVLLPEEDYPEDAGYYTDAAASEMPYVEDIPAGTELHEEPLESSDDLMQ